MTQNATLGFLQDSAGVDIVMNVRTVTFSQFFEKNDIA